LKYKKEVLPYLRFNILINNTLTTLNLKAMPKNTFNGAIMSYADVSTYYPTNSNFDHFVFQQMLPDSSDPDNSFALCAYAVFASASGLPPVLISLQPNLNGKGYKGPKGAQFANMKLDLGELAILYPPGGGAGNIIIEPVGPYLGTDYVTYSASTMGSINGGTNTVTLDPSPPHQS
jgi:hypothetical protein